MYNSMIDLLIKGTWETIFMTFVSGFSVSYQGFQSAFHFITRKGQIKENKTVNSILSVLVNIFRAIPFIILIVWMIPFTRIIVGTSIGVAAALVPLSIGAAPFIARMVENQFAGNTQRTDRSFARYGSHSSSDYKKGITSRSVAFTYKQCYNHSYYTCELLCNGWSCWSRRSWDKQVINTDMWDMILQ